MNKIVQVFGNGNLSKKKLFKKKTYSKKFDPRTNFVRCWIEHSLVITTQEAQLRAHSLFDLVNGLNILANHLTIDPEGHKQTLNSTGCQVGSFGLHERVSTEKRNAYLRLSFLGLGEQVDERTVLLVVQAICILLTRKSGFGHVFTQLYTRLTIDLDELEHAAERGLLLTRDQVSANAERVDRVALAVERVENVFVYVIAGHDCDLLEPGHVEGDRDAFEERANLQTQIG